MKKISPWLRAFRALVRFAVWIFFRKMEVSGIENIPEEGPVIFAPNHQNAFLDALVVIQRIERLPFSLARADIFDSAFFAKLLFSIRMLPVYRLRDGQRRVAQNHEVFERAGAILNKGYSLLIFPEANHDTSFRLRAINKGFARLTLEAAAHADFENEMWVVPVGITYENFTGFRQKVFVTYGKPIAISQYEEHYKEHPQKTINALREDLAQQIRPLVLDLQPEERYEDLNRLRLVLRPVVARRLEVPLDGPAADFRVDKATETALEGLSDEEFSQVVYALRRYEALLQEGGVSPIGPIPERWPKPTWRRRFFTWLVLLPVAFYAWLNHLPLSGMIKFALGRLVSQPGFVASIKLVLGLVGVPVFYTLQTLLVWGFSGSGWVALAYLLSLPVSAAGLFYARELGKGLRIQGQWTAFQFRQPELFAELQQWHSQLQRAVRNVS